MVSISSDLAWALGMVPDCLLPSGELPQYRDEYGGGWFWFTERHEGPRRYVLTDAKKHEIARFACRHPKRTDNGGAH